MTTRAVDLLPAAGVHGSRPATAPDGALYSCTTHGLVYRYTTALGWVTWATLGSSGAVLLSTVTTKGDLLTTTASATMTRRPVGSNGQVLTADSAETDGVKWATPAAATYVGFKAYRSAAYNLVNITSTPVPWDAEATDGWDTNTFHDNSTNPSRGTVPSGQNGKYVIFANVGAAGSFTGRFILQILWNGAGVRGAYADVTSSGLSFPSHNVTCELDLAVGDYVEAAYYRDGGGTVAMNLTNSAFGMRKVS